MPKVSFHAPDWDVDVEIPGVPRMGETVVVDGKTSLVTEVVWNLEGIPTVHITVDPKPAE